MEDREMIALIEGAQSGGSQAMEELLRRAHTSVSYQCRKLLRDPRDVEDMTQEILLTVYERLPLLKNPAAFWGWLNRITITRCINALKRTHVELQFAQDEDGHSVLDDLEELDEQQVPDKALDNTETTRMIEEIVNGLPEAQRICTLMYYFDEMSVRDISETVGVPENTVKSRLNYARKAIREQVLDYEKKGVKLYGLSPLPFLLYFLGRAARESASPVEAAAAAKRVMQLGAAAGGTAAAAGASAAGASAAGGTAAAAGTATSHLLGGLSVKLVAGALASILALGGIAGAVVIAQRNSAEEPEPSATMPAETEAVSSEPAVSAPIETDNLEESQSPEIPDPMGSLYETVTVYDPNTYIARTTLVTDLANLEIFFEFPVFPESTSGTQIINTFFRGLRDEFFRDEIGSIERALDAARNPMISGDSYMDTYRCSIETFDNDITSVFMMGNWYIGGIHDGRFPAYTFRSATGEQLGVLDVLGCTAYELDGLLTQALTREGLLNGADLSGSAAQYPFYVSDSSVYIGVNIQMYRGEQYVRIDAPIQTGVSTPSAPPSGNLSDLLGSVAYYGDPARCAMTADQARAFAEVIRAQSAELERTYAQNQSWYENELSGMAPHCYAALVDTGSGVPILICAGALDRGPGSDANDRKVYWEYLSTFSVWQYVNGRAVQFQPEGGGLVAAITSSGVWFGWNGSADPHYEMRTVKGRLYPFQNGGISEQAANTIYGSLELFQINGASVTQQEFEAQLAGFASDIFVTSTVNGDPSGGFSGVSPAEQILDALLILGGL